MRRPTGHHTPPTAARVHNYLLGGKDHRRADRAAADLLCTRAPEIPEAVRQIRLFGHRAVQHLARAGVAQVIDLGCGLPLTSGLNIHDIAQQVNPAARVVYVDHDPTVASYATALLTLDDRTTSIVADLTYPGQVLDHRHTRSLLDLTAPVAVLCLSVGHLISDTALHRTLTTLAACLPAGSHLVYGQLAATSTQAAHELRLAGRAAGLHWHPRPVPDITQALQHFDPAASGFGDLTSWRPDPHQQPLPTPTAHQLRPDRKPELVIPYGGVLHTGDPRPDTRQENPC